MRPSGIRVIGLTGGVATGKSSVARFFEERGVPVVDADQLAREAVKPGSPCLARLAALFGAGVLRGDGTLDRKRVAGIVFADAGKRRQLEALLHPEIRRLAEERIARAAAAGQRTLVYMAPLLIEAGVTDRVDEIWVVTVRPEVQLERLMARDGIGREEAERIIGSQMPLAEKERHGRVVIDNSGTLEETRLLLAAIWDKEIAVHHE
ncbi:dephospho-CoA kinase [Oryzomonas sagensis]|uniref:Dephospho-CoA kinase n=1 Tax=Oryzomonas sagensis TaxID=2603857 RepID=A0ABQ6TTG2_9BACT|nr:dephospho-CoA kinase [Oryzomonas sagensis]